MQIRTYIIFELSTDIYVDMSVDIRVDMLIQIIQQLLRSSKIMIRILRFSRLRKTDGRNSDLVPNLSYKQCCTTTLGCHFSDSEHTNRTQCANALRVKENVMNCTRSRRFTNLGKHVKSATSIGPACLVWFYPAEETHDFQWNVN